MLYYRLLRKNKMVKEHFTTRKIKKIEHWAHRTHIKLEFAVSSFRRPLKLQPSLCDGMLAFCFTSFSFLELNHCQN